MESEAILFGESEARVALTFNGGTLYLNKTRSSSKFRVHGRDTAIIGIIPKRLLSLDGPRSQSKRGYFGFLSRNAGFIPIPLFGKCLSRHKYLYLVV